MSDRISVQKIRFNGLDFILPDGREGSPVVTIDDYKQGKVSYAQLYPSGNIMQFGRQIGTIEDIEFGDFVDIDMDLAEFASGFFGDSWPK